LTDLAAAVGLAFVIEGLLFAAFPGFVRARLEQALKEGNDRMRIVGLFSAVVGLGIVWVARQGAG
jgi:uncharacterized protein YjeT (DUF2065 family)